MIVIVIFIQSLPTLIYNKNIKYMTSKYIDKNCEYFFLRREKKGGYNCCKNSVDYLLLIPEGYYLSKRCVNKEFHTFCFELKSCDGYNG
jgi:hypothetical protein